MNSVKERIGFCPSCSLKRPSRGWPADRFVGRLVDDKYRLERRLGAGGFALVFLARQVQGEIDLGQVVLKFLQQNLADNESVRRRFTNEARAARKVGSPHVVKVFDLGFDEEGLPYMVMEYIQGDSLDALMKRRKPMAIARALHIGLQVASALEECHQAEIIHRDLKPDNLMLLSGRDEDFVKVLDFGIARVPSEDGPVTKTIMGTPRYMPPEQIMQQGIDGGADIFALGVILYECLAGRSPIKCQNSMEYLHKNLTVSPTPLLEVCPDMPDQLGALLSRMMAKDRSDRPASMADVEQRLRAILEQGDWTSASASRPLRPTEDVDPNAETIAPPSSKNSGLLVDDLDLPPEEDPPAGETAHTGRLEQEAGAAEDLGQLERSETILAPSPPPHSRTTLLALLAALGVLLTAGVWFWGPWERPAQVPSPSGGQDVKTEAPPAKASKPPPPSVVTPGDAGAPPADSRPAMEAATKPRAPARPRPLPKKKKGRKKDEWGKEEGGL